MRFVADYNKDQLNTMRQDAIRRVQEMQRRSQNFIVPEPPQSQPKPKEPVIKQETRQNNNQNTSNNFQRQNSGTSQFNRNNQFSHNAQNNTSANNQNSRQNPSNNFQNRQANGQNMNAGYNNNPFSALFGNQPNTSNEHSPHENHDNSEKENKNFFSGIFEEFLPNLKLDDDKIIIIILLIVLARNGSDIKLLLALGYLLM